VGAEPDVLHQRDRAGDIGGDGHRLVAAHERVVPDGGEDAMGRDVAVRADAQSAPAVENAVRGEVRVVADFDQALFVAGGDVGAGEEIDVAGDDESPAFSLDEAVRIKVNVVADVDQLGMFDVDVLVDDDV